MQVRKSREQGSLTPDTEPRFARHRLLRPAGRSVVPTVPAVELVGCDGLPPRKIRGVLLCRQGDIAEAAGSGCPFPPAGQDPRHGPEDTVFILQLFLEIEKTAALRQHWHPGAGCRTDLRPQSPVPAQLPGIQFRIASAQIQALCPGR